MTEKDYHLYGTKILNLKTQEIGLLICIWENKFADAEIDYATCVDKQYPEFRKKFVKGIRGAFESYRKTQLNKYSYNFKDNNSMEYNFYFQLQ